MRRGIPSSGPNAPTMPSMRRGASFLRRSAGSFRGAFALAGIASLFVAGSAGAQANPYLTSTVHACAPEVSSCTFQGPLHPSVGTVVAGPANVFTANVRTTFHETTLSYETLLNLSSETSPGSLRFRFDDQIEFAFQGSGAENGQLNRVDFFPLAPDVVILDVDFVFPAPMIGMQLDVAVAAPVPEPAMVPMLGMGAGLLAWKARRRSRRR